MPKRIAQIPGLIVFLVLLALAPFAAASEGGVVRNGARLSLNFHDTALKVVLQQLQRDARITVKIPPALLNRSVTIKLQNVDIDPALETLFKSASLRNFAIVHEPGAQGRITVVMVEEGKGGSAPAMPDTAHEDSGVSEPPALASQPVAGAPDPLAGVRWTSAKASDSDPDAPPPQTVPQLPQFAAEEASGPSQPQEMAVGPPSAVPESMLNLPPEPGPKYRGGPEGSPLTPQMRANMGFPPASGHY